MLYGLVWKCTFGEWPKDLRELYNGSLVTTLKKSGVLALNNNSLYFFKIFSLKFFTIHYFNVSRLVGNRKGFLVAQMVKNPPAIWETWVQPLQFRRPWEDPLEKGMVTHSSTLTWRIPWTEEPGRLQSMGLQRVRHNFHFHQFHWWNIHFHQSAWLVGGSCVHSLMVGV